MLPPGERKQRFNPGLIKQSEGLKQQTHMNSVNRSSGSFLPAAIISLLLVAVFCYSWQNLYVDDAFIGFRCIDNFLNGHGMVFNQGERVESVTNIGWLITLLPLSLLFDIPLAGKIGGILFLILNVVTLTIIGSKIDRSSQTIKGQSFLRYIVPVLIFSSPAFVYFSQSGMETAMICFLISTPLFLSESSGRLVKIAIIYAFTALVRPECIILFPIYLLAHIVTNLKVDSENQAILKKTLLSSIVVWFAIIAVLTLCRFAYFGDIVPNTFHAKHSSLSDILARVYLFMNGKLENLPMPYSGLFFAFIFCLGSLILASMGAEIFCVCFAGAITGLIFSVYSAPDWTMMPRYIAPYSPYCLFIIFCGLKFSIDGDSKNRVIISRIFSVLIFLFLLLNNFVDGQKWLGNAARTNYPGYVITCATLHQAVADMKGILPEAAVLATRRIGLAGYIIKREIFDYAFGLPNSDVTAIKKKAGRLEFDDPGNPLLKELWQKRKPTYLLEDESRIISMLDKQPGTVDAFSLHGVAYQKIRTYKLGENDNWLLYAAIDH